MSHIVTHVYSREQENGPRKNLRQPRVGRVASDAEGAAAEGRVLAGDLGPKPRGEWLKLVDRVEEALVGQGDWVDGADEQVLEIVEKVRAARQRKPRKAIAKAREEAGEEASDVVAVHTDRVMMEEPHPHGG